MDLSTAQAAIEDFYRRIYWQGPGAVTQSTPDYTLSYSGVTWLHSINQLWLHHPETLDDDLLALAHHFFTRHRAEYSVVVMESQPPRLVPWLAERRYTERFTSPIYALHGLPRPFNIHREVRVVRACAEQQHELLEVLYGVFFMGPEIARRIVRPEHFVDPSIRHYLAYVGREPAACATIMLDAHIAGVWNVGTLRHYRKQGIAAALLMYALIEAATDGCPDSVLVASPMGRPLYEEMGYQLLGTGYHYGPPD